MSTWNMDNYENIKIKFLGRIKGFFLHFQQTCAVFNWF